ncbi:MAG: hypothetical protein KIH04_08445 [Candidatus Freyarchaeota archaeon]|nr:hypothetical protein [Candidatus Jordarchaeia archaeon]
MHGVEVKKVDEQGRIVLPADWRQKELGESREVIVIKGEGVLKIIPKKRVDLTRFFDSIDLGVNVGDWDGFEGRFYRDEVSRR